MKKKWNIYLVPHTHWDKEWYFTKNVSSVFMYWNIEKIYDFFQDKKNENFKFVYDSQFSIVNDYLNINRDNKFKIEEMIKKNQLIVSPWYTQTDTVNVVGESIVRNMLTGIKESEKFGNYMRVAYLPDSFGFNSNLPQIFNLFEMKAFIHWRGITDDTLKGSALNKWVGADGSEILTYNLFKYGYSCGAGQLYDLFKDGYDKDDVKGNALKYLDTHKDFNDGMLMDDLKSVTKNLNNNILYPFGSDQLPIYENTIEMVEEMNKLDKEHNYVLTGYEEFIDKIIKETDQSKLNKFSGELRFGQYARVHKTITSSRFDIKQKIKNIEYLIYQIAEPLNLIYELHGGKYNHKLINEACHLLMEAQSHDSAGGCNSDETNKSIVERLDAARDIIESLCTLVKRQIAFSLKSKYNDVLIFNLQPYNRKLNFKMIIFTRLPNFKVMFDEKELKFNILNQTKIDATNFTKHEKWQFNREEDFIDNKTSYWTEIEILDLDLKATSMALCKIKEFKNSSDIIKVSKDLKATSIENEFLKLKIKNNSLSLYNKITNKTFMDFVKLESDADAGDTYDFSPLNMNQKQNSKLIKVDVEIVNNIVSKQMNLHYIYEVPESLNSKKSIEQNVYLTLSLNGDNLDINLKFNNVAKDIRWRAIFNTDIKNNNSFSDTAFGSIKRESDYSKELELWKHQEWSEYPINIEVMESVCWKHQENNMFSVFTKGNNEYQIIGDFKEKLAITLFRAVSFIGRENLEFRPGRASGISEYPFETPESNLFNFPIDINLRVNTNNISNIVKKAKEWCIPSTYYQTQNVNTFYIRGDKFALPTEKLNSNITFDDIFINIKLPEELVVSSLKKTYDGKKNILRIYNPTDKEICLEFAKDLKEVNLLEKEIFKSKTICKNQIKSFIF